MAYMPSGPKDWNLVHVPCYFLLKLVQPNGHLMSIQHEYDIIIQYSTSNCCHVPTGIGYDQRNEDQ